MFFSYYGHYTLLLEDNFEPYDGMDFMKAATRTHFIDGLPEDYYASGDAQETGNEATLSKNDVEVEGIMKDVEGPLRQCIELEHKRT